MLAAFSGAHDQAGDHKDGKLFHGWSIMLDKIPPEYVGAKALDVELLHMYLRHPMNI